ncbi:unnamed protein product [Prunus armeniaca]
MIKRTGLKSMKKNRWNTEENEMKKLKLSVQNWRACCRFRAAEGQKRNMEGDVVSQESFDCKLTERRNCQNSKTMLSKQENCPKNSCRIVVGSWRCSDQSTTLRYLGLAGQNRERSNPNTSYSHQFCWGHHQDSWDTRCGCHSGNHFYYLRCTAQEGLDPPEPMCSFHSTPTVGPLA